MRKIILFTILIASVGSSLVSCKKWLELKPQDGIVREEFWQTKEQVEAAVTGIYASMLGSATNNDRALAEYMFLWGEARTDMVSPGFRAVQDELDIININVLPTNQFVNWRSFYQTINYCNTVIELAPGVRSIDQTFTQQQLDRAIGEALTIRSLMYFYLARSFSDVPLKLNATLSDEDVVAIPKSTQNQVLDQIVADLKKAEPMVQLPTGNRPVDKGRVNRYTVNALLADVYLWMNRYEDCATECDKIISSNNFGLVSGENGAAPFFNELFYAGNSNEIIFSLQFDAQKLNPFYTMHVSGSRRWGAAPHLLEEVYGVDLSGAVPPLVDLRGDNGSFRANDLAIWKYIGADGNGSNTRPLDQSYAHWIFYRYADVLLMKAEAINMNNAPLEASRIVKQIRNRAHALDLGVPMDSTNVDAMADFIVEERQREFAFEGKRWYDVLRNAKRDDYKRLYLIQRMVSKSVAPDRQQAAINKLRDKNSHYFPIYFYEIQTNKELVQNPFYK
ncbi:RagB/SusD family nutrient uptake outer membrane protein [Parasegetibacter sp. NRK P23]|uniref:RagB/SusD family nutrient uptake outer membrane protein n=1 Tax=Parasegetibacter sp. NRK P23 TaxID=2942999 RepID=UPI002043E004|nr:RagB/SusD family nutrient uptake outer membrane protein [Parasegetibacter sp. NRK P23]MCM5529841.1 RagB/SusD family nutrient uptake outer membrane protein [Parasegetibacter sp. NRK P23]